MQASEQWKYCWYLDFIIIFGLLIVEIWFILILKGKHDKVLTFNIIYFLNFEVTLPSNKRRA